MKTKALLGCCCVLGICGSIPAYAQPSPIVCRENGGPEICVRFDNLGVEPIENVDFTVSFDAFGVPSIDLLRGDDGLGTTFQWRIWSWDLFIIGFEFPQPIDQITGLAAFDYDVKILQPDGDAGATTVNLINLTPSSTAKSSSITAGHITGDLTSNLTVAKDTSDNGGGLNMTIDGTVAAGSTITVDNLSFLNVGGNLEGALNVTNMLPEAEIFIDGAVTSTGSITISGNAEIVSIGGNLDATVSIATVSNHLFLGGDVSGDVTIDELKGGLWIATNVAASAEITIQNFLGGPAGGAIIIGKVIGVESFFGTLRLQNGIPSSLGVSFHSVVEEGAVIDFMGADSQKQDLNGILFLEAGGAGVVTNINELSGAIPDLGLIGVFSGTVTMATLSGSIRTSTGEFPADLGGNIHVTGDVTFTGEIAAGGLLDASIDVDGDMDGSISGGAGPSLEILVGGLINGNINIGGAFSGNICAVNVPPGGPLPSNIILASIDPATGATLCTYAIECVLASDCNDTNGETDDSCVDNICWNPCNAGATSTCAPLAPSQYHQTKKNRYVSFDPGNAVSVAFEVTQTGGSGSPANPRWVGPPDGNGVSPVVDQAYYSSTWPALIHVGGCYIIPDATYEIRAKEVGSPLSAALVLNTITKPGTKFWGDVVGSFDGQVWTQPDGATNFIDVQATIKGFQGEPNAAHLTWLDVHPRCPNGVRNIDDTFQIILAFQEAEYPFDDPSDCDGTCPGRATGGIDFRMVADYDLIDPDDQIVIDVHVDPASDVGVYEMSLEVLGGTTGSLDLSGMNVNKARGDYIFGTSSVADAVDNVGARLGAAMSDGTGVEVTTANDYLGTFTYTASSDAFGVFEVKVRPVDEAYLSDSNVDGIGTSPGDSLFIGVDVECVHDGHCEDANECTDDTCVNNVCQYTANNCDDANVCTTDTCNVDVCEHGFEPSGTPCEDGQFCTEPDTCDGAGTCVGGPDDPCLETEICIEFMDTCIPEQGGGGT